MYQAAGDPVIGWMLFCSVITYKVLISSCLLHPLSPCLSHTLKQKACLHGLHGVINSNPTGSALCVDLSVIAVNRTLTLMK